jgi:hypothetical protein
LHSMKQRMDLSSMPWPPFLPLPLTLSRFYETVLAETYRQKLKLSNKTSQILQVKPRIFVQNYKIHIWQPFLDEKLTEIQG